MNDSQLGKIFTVESPCCLKDVRIYQFTFKEDGSYDAYSFYFRFSSLKNLHKKAKDHGKILPKSAYLGRLWCWSKKTTNRTNEFIRYFKRFFNINFPDAHVSASITNFTQFLDILGLSCDNNKDFLTFNGFQHQLQISDPFKEDRDSSDEVNTSEYPFLHIDPLPIDPDQNQMGVTPSEPPTLGLSKTTISEIELNFKKEENKISFLCFLEEKIKEFPQKNSVNNEIQVPNLRNIRLLIMKLQLKILHKVINDIQNMPEIGGIYVVEKFFKKFMETERGRKIAQRFKDYNKETIKKFKTLQNELLTNMEKKSFLEKKSVDEVLRFLNPQIASWDDFCKDLKSLLNPALRKLNEYILGRVINSDLEAVSENSRNVVILFKNFQVLLNMKRIFENMEFKEVQEFSLRMMEEKDAIGSLRKILEDLTLIH